MRSADGGQPTAATTGALWEATMARGVKHPDVRRDELLDIALDLIMTRGFAATSVEQITNAVGVAKGTFYYYFASKDDLLAQLVGRFGDSMFANLSNAPLSGSGLHQLQDFLAAATRGIVR